MSFIRCWAQDPHKRLSAVEIVRKLKRIPYKFKHETPLTRQLLLTHSLMHSLTHSLTHAFMHSLISLIHSFIHSFITLHYYLFILFYLLQALGVGQRLGNHRHLQIYIKCRDLSHILLLLLIGSSLLLILKSKDTILCMYLATLAFELLS